jgi:hypothetical protein
MLCACSPSKTKERAGGSVAVSAPAEASPVPPKSNQIGVHKPMQPSQTGAEVVTGARADKAAEPERAAQAITVPANRPSVAQLQSAYESKLEELKALFPTLQGIAVDGTSREIVLVVAAKGAAVQPVRDKYDEVSALLKQPVRLDIVPSETKEW